MRRAFTQAVSVKTDCCTEIGSVKVASSDAAARRLSIVIAVCTLGADECVSSLRFAECEDRSCTNFMKRVASRRQAIGHGRRRRLQELLDELGVHITVHLLQTSVGVGLSGTDPAMEKSSCCRVRGLVPVIRACVRGVPDRPAVVGVHRSSSRR